MEQMEKFINREDLNPGYIEVSGQRVEYITITMRISYDTFDNFYYVVFLWRGQSNINITPNIYIYVKT